MVTLWTPVTLTLLASVLGVVAVGQAVALERASMSGESQINANNMTMQVMILTQALQAAEQRFNSEMDRMKACAAKRMLYDATAAGDGCVDVSAVCTGAGPASAPGGVVVPADFRPDEAPAAGDARADVAGAF